MSRRAGAPGDPAGTVTKNDLRGEGWVVEEIGAAARAASADLFVSDDQLSPIQERNISEALGIKVIDRTALILDIFARRARTREGKLQVELAQLQHLATRLIRALERIADALEKQNEEKHGHAPGRPREDECEDLGR